MSAMTDRRNGIQYKTVIALAVVWVLLWGQLSVANVVLGVAVGLLVTLVFPLPPISFHGRLRPWGAIRMVLRLLYDLVVSSFIVVVRVFQFGRTFDNAVLRVPLRSHSDLYMTLTAELTCLVPGSVVLEARRASDTIYIHVMDVRGPEDLEAARRGTLASEQRVLRALGSAEELACLRGDLPIPRTDSRPELPTESTTGAPDAADPFEGDGTEQEGSSA
ncbi:Na+/H+ antiporter subunit E [Propionibacteriaceae bacterium Y1685]|uniref:Na+/H+ antiporter subunit E n=1 Tax=Microlunatus sp. Y1700 TaxID=3418487 RepID=UPI003B76C3EE